MPKRSISELVQEKRKWHTPSDLEVSKLGFRGWHSRGYLPHFDQPGLIQFINYRLADAMPEAFRSEWTSLLAINDDLKRYERIESYLDQGLGACELRDSRAASIIEANWLHMDGKEYRLLAWCVMPNHVHLLVEIWQKPQARLVRDWKGLTARRINRVLGRTGQLWQEDYWDRYIRDEEHCRKVMHYIEMNPVKAKLVKTSHEWPFSSARFRDEYNRLKEPK
jgi:REP element-mobilizing transposase RayT